MAVQGESQSIRDAVIASVTMERKRKRVSLTLRIHQQDPSSAILVMALKTLADAVSDQLRADAP